MATRIVTLYRRLSRWPAGRWLFSRAVCLKAPYFATIAPTVTALEPGRCEVRMRDRRRVRNHIGTVHAIALCNMAELAGGLVTDWRGQPIGADGGQMAIAGDRACLDEALVALKRSAK